MQPAGTDRIQFSFVYKGKRYRPTVQRKPTEANLRRALTQLKEIKERIKHGTFDFRQEFPDYRCTETLEVGLPGRSPAIAPEPSPARQRDSTPEKTCDEAFDAFLALYVANTDAIVKFSYQSGETQIATTGVEFADLPGTVNSDAVAQSVVPMRAGIELMKGTSGEPAQITDDWYSRLLEPVGATDSGQFQQLRRMLRARAQMIS